MGAVGGKVSSSEFRILTLNFLTTASCRYLIKKYHISAYCISLVGQCLTSYLTGSDSVANEELLDVDMSGSSST